MAQASVEKDLPVSKKAFFNTIIRYEDYPQFVDGVKEIRVERKAPGKARVHYVVSIMKELRYSVDITEDFEAGKVHWVLGESEFFKKNSGSWEMKEISSDKIHVKYTLDLEFSFPVPGLILKKLVSGNLPKVVDQFEERTLENGG